MKRVALALLLAMLALIVLCALLQPTYPWLKWVRAFAEAAAVGALADWFAVTALFRHPLGLPIPHTAIIPRNKNEIGVALGEFVEHNFLTPDNVLRKLAQQELARSAVRWLGDPQQRALLARRACAAFGVLIQRLDDEDVRAFIDRTLTPRLQRLNVARIAGELLDLLTTGNRHQALLDHGLRALDAWLTANRELIRQRVSRGSWLMPRFVDAYVANRFVDGVQALLHEAGADPAHEVRVRFDAAAREFIQALKTSPQARRRSAALLRAFIRHVRREGYYRGLWQEIRARLRADLARPDSVLQQHLELALQALTEALAKDDALLRKLDRWTLQALEVMLLRHRHQVSRLIAEVVRGWDARMVSEKVEREIGRDLQFIRINGTLVGGIAGVLLHAIP